MYVVKILKFLNNIFGLFLVFCSHNSNGSFHVDLLFVWVHVWFTVDLNNFKHRPLDTRTEVVTHRTTGTVNQRV